MRRNGRLSAALHVLLHMAQRPDVTVTSQEMAVCAGTNPVVIRRTFAGLRQAGIVSSRKGHGGGWRLARPPSAVNLEQVQRALGEHVVTVASRDEHQGCLVERAVHLALDDAIAEATGVLNRRLATISLADLVSDVDRLERQTSVTSGDMNHAV